MIVNVRAQAALIAPGSDITGLRDLFSELLSDPAVVSRLAYLTAGADVHYAMGPEATHPLAGRFSPELTVQTGAGPARIAELTHSAPPLVLDMTPTGAFAEALSEWQGRVDVVRAESLAGSSPVSFGHETGDEPPAVLLLRPDCYVAWASSTCQPGSTELNGLRDAVSRWFGAAPVSAVV